MDPEEVTSDDSESLSDDGVSERRENVGDSDAAQNGVANLVNEMVVEDEEELNTETKQQIHPLRAVNRYISFLNAQSHVAYEDVLPTVVDGRRFLIDGDALLIHALSTDGLNLYCGGQMLHAIFLVESFLNTLIKKSLNFNIIFFKVWEGCWENSHPDVALLRSCLRLHLKHNTPITVTEDVHSLWDKEFADLLNRLRPSFLMTCTAYSSRIFKDLQQVSMIKSTEKLKADATKMDIQPKDWFIFLIHSQSLWSKLLSLEVIDLNSVTASFTKLMGLQHTSSGEFEPRRMKICTAIKRGWTLLPVATVNCRPSDINVCGKNLRKTVAIMAVSSLQNEQNGKITDKNYFVFQIFMLHFAMMEFMPMKARCFKSMPELPSDVMQLIILLQKKMYFAVNSLVGLVSDFNVTLVADLWHGLFYQAVYNCVSQYESVQREHIGERLASEYEDLISLCGIKRSPFPISIPRGSASQKRGKMMGYPESSVIQLKRLIPTTCKLTKLFCGDILKNADVEQASSLSVAELLEEVGARGETFQELYHWHTRKRLTDEYDRIPDDKPEPVANKRYAQSQRNKFARWTTVYGLSLEGRSCTHSIVTAKEDPHTEQEPKRKHAHQQKGGKVKPLSKKDKIIQENLKRRETEKQKKAQDRFKTFLLSFDSLMKKGMYKEALQECDFELKNTDGQGMTVIEIMFKKAEICHKFWCKECDHQPLNDKREMSFSKKLFLTVKEILKVSEELKIDLNEKKRTFLSLVLWDLGFEDLAQCWKLPKPISAVTESHNVGMSHVRFQLQYTSTDLDRDTRGKPDPRVQGFNPDPWQAKLFDIVDSNQSAVVVAPTSSGKTYASYYCMEKVIRASDNGIVIYVCPTKALVNQVHATIYARFKKNLPPGKALLGTFTRDYRSNVLNCQILTTVPEALELLLLSPRRHTWVKNVRYVIFDEVHCLSGQSGGIAWENSLLLIKCPFLALSATINEPESFCAWLQKAEEWKKAQAALHGFKDRSAETYKVHLVVHLERHNHLKKSIMHYDGTVEPIHPYAFLDETTIAECGGIPAHISLAPDETLQLFLAMEKIFSPNMMEDLSPEKHFKEVCQSGFLTMPSVKAYSEKIRNFLQEKASTSEMAALVKSFRLDLQDIDMGLMNVYHNITSVLEYLRENQMMPAISFTYNRTLLEALPEKLLEYLDSFDDYEDDSDSTSEDESVSKGGKLNKKQEQREFKRNRIAKSGRGLDLLKGPSIMHSKSSIRGAGHADEKVIDFIEKRLVRDHKATDNFPSMLRKGLALHYAGMNNKQRSAVEILFRMKVLNLVHATGTLALGIHMPCKTVVVAGNSPYLTSLEYHQMSGRAGRRGFDDVGHVIFFGINRRKIQTLLTANVPKLVGNFPVSLTLILRLLLLISDVTDEGKVSEDVSQAALSSAHTLLENSLIYKTNPGLKDQIKHFFVFASQFLIYQGFIDEIGHPKLLSSLITHLHYHEPANFAFCYLLRAGALEKLCKCDRSGKVRYESLISIVTALNYLFAPLPLNPLLLRRKSINSVVVLPDLNPGIKKALKMYNKEVTDIFNHYYQCVATHLQTKNGDDNCLPLSKVLIKTNCQGTAYQTAELVQVVEKLSQKNKICSSFAGLSGITDADIFSSDGALSHIREDANPGVKIVPTLVLNGLYNSYALDFFKHGIPVAIVRDNGIKGGQVYHSLLDFLLVLKTIQTSFTELLPPESKLVQAVDRINTIYGSNFLAAFNK